MENLKLYILALVSILLFNCSNDDDTTQAQSILQPATISLEKESIDLLGADDLPRTYTLEYNDDGKIIAITSSRVSDRVNHNITYQNNRISEITYNSLGGPTTTSFTYNSDGIITSVEETGPEARSIANFQYNDDDNSYVMTLNGIGIMMFSVALNNNNHILWYNGRLITFNTTEKGLFKNSIGDITPLYFALPYRVNQELYFFSKHQIETAHYSTSPVTYGNYQRNEVNDITTYRTNIDSDRYLNYTITY